MMPPEGHPYERALLEGRLESELDDVRQLRDALDALEERRVELLQRRYDALSRVLRIETRLEALRGVRRAS